jgi:predicted helicase
VYAILNHPEYKSKFAADLKRQLPRIPILTTFTSLSSTGKLLFELHVGYEREVTSSVTVTNTYSGSSEAENFRVEKMAYGKGGDKTKITFNKFITISEIPIEVFDFMVGGKSGVDWIVDRYRVTVDKDSRISNDPNSYSEDPKYILNLILGVIELSRQSLDITNSMPPLDL